VKRVVRVVLNIALVVFIVSVLLLLNITAPNPTHRRYSSQMPLTTGQGSGNAIGDSSEIILSTDLRLPNNNASDQRQCLCKSMSSANGKACNLCLPVNDLQSDFRIPDFIAPDFMAESKNTQNLLYTGREYDQISDYALAAKLLNRPLWVYIRVDTIVAPDFYEIVHATGGNVIPYFTVPGYVDPIDDAARKSGVASGGILFVFALMMWRSRQRHDRLPAPKMITASIVKSPDNGATRKMSHAEDFTASAKERLQAKVDEEDAWNDL
jgi:hypothetical protein